MARWRLKQARSHEGDSPLLPRLDDWLALAERGGKMALPGSALRSAGMLMSSGRIKAAEEAGGPPGTARRSDSLEMETFITNSVSAVAPAPKISDYFVKLRLLGTSRADIFARKILNKIIGSNV